MGLRSFVPIYCLKAVAASLAMTFLLGCAKEDPIVTYTVPKHDRIQIPVETPKDATITPPKSQQQKAVPTRTLAALIMDKEVAWFFKGMAPIGDFSDDVSEKFDELIKSTKFEDPMNPTWELGESWTQSPPTSSMRHANLMLGNVVFSVIKLTLPDSDGQKYTLDNINRWRKELSLPEIKTGDIESNARKIITADQHDATLVDIEGMSSGSARGPMAGGGAPRRIAPKREAEPTTEEKSPPFTGTPPENWKPQKLRMFQLASYEAKDGDAIANISVSKAGGSLLMNVNRWRGQVGLDEYAEESDIEAEEITVGEKPGLLTEMKGSAGESIVVAIVPEGQRAWFIKLMGKTAAVEKETEAFKEYLDTIEFN